MNLLGQIKSLQKAKIRKHPTSILNLDVAGFGNAKNFHLSFMTISMVNSINYTKTVKVSLSPAISGTHNNFSSPV